MIGITGRVLDLKILNESVTSNADFSNVGGLTGVNYGIVQEVFTDGVIDSLGTAGIVGGIVGQNVHAESSFATGVISKSASTANISAVGRIDAGNTNVGVGWSSWGPSRL
jgi:hypothetical protein